MNIPYVNIHTHHDAEGAATISSLGIHPWDAERCNIEQPEMRRAFENDVEAVDAVGEIGLDYAAEVDREAQKRIFVAQLKIAKKHRKPVIIHCVKAFEATMQMLSTFPIRGVIFHGFIGSVQQMNQAIERGYYISFGERTFASPKSLKALRECPLERLFLETDMSSCTIEVIYSRIERYRIESPEQLREGIYNNYKTLFNK